MNVLLMLLLFAVAPSWIFGDYADGPDHLEITTSHGNTVSITGEVQGHAYANEGEWNGGLLRVKSDTGTLFVHFKNGKIIADGHTLPSILGRYSNTDEKSFIEINRVDDGRTHVTGELPCVNGNTCTIDGYGTWTGDTLRVPQANDCVLILHFKDDTVATADAEGKCFQAVVLSK